MSKPQSKPTFSLRPGLADLLVLLVLLTPFFLKYGHFADDPGVGWHLQTGDWILANGSVPYADPFLASTIERAWVSDQWLSDVLLAWVYTHFSWVGLYALLTAVFIGLYFGIVQRFAAATSGTWVGAAFATLCALKLATIHFILRPVLLGFLFFAVVFGVCARISNSVNRDIGFAEGPLLKRLLVLVPLFMLWANCHPSVILGLVALAILAIAFFLEPFFFPASHEHKDRWYAAGAKVAAVLLLCFGATLLNPYGIDLHQSIFSLAGSDFFVRFNNEWHSPDFLEGSAQLALVVFVLIFGSRYLDGGKGQKLNLFEFGALIAFTIAYLQSVRLLPFLSIVLAIPLAIAAKNLSHAYVFEWMEGLEPLKKSIRWLERWEGKSSHGMLGLAISALVLGGAVATGSLPRADFELGPTHENYPYGAIEHLLASGDDASVFATPNWGGFVTRMGHGRIRAHIDDRNTLLGEEFYQNYLEIAGLRSPQWLDKLRATGATHLLVARDSALHHAAAAAQLREVHADARTVLFEVR